MILKDTTIGSGSIIGGNSVVSKKTIKSNLIYAGNPAKKIKENVFYSTPISTHNYNEEQELNSDNYIYEFDNNTISLKKIDCDLLNIKNVEGKLKYIRNNISNNNNKNIFYI